MSWRDGAPKAHPNNIAGTARGNGAKGSSGRLAGVPAEGEDGWPVSRWRRNDSKHSVLSETGGERRELKGKHGTKQPLNVKE